MPNRINYPSPEEARIIANAKLAEANALPPGPERQKLLKEAGSYKVLSEVKGWLAGELRPPT